MQSPRKFRGNRTATRKPTQATPVIPTRFRTVDRLIAAGRLEDALVDLDEMISKDPDDLDVLERLLSVCLTLNDWPEATEWATNLSILQPDNAEYVFALIQIYASQNFTIHILKYLKTFIDRWPDHEQFKAMQSFYEASKADLEENVKRSDLDADQYFDAVSRNEELQLLMRTERFAEALDLARELIGTYPNYLPPYNNLAEISMSLGDFVTAKEFNLRALEIEPHNLYSLSFAIRLARINFESAEIVAGYAARFKASGQPANKQHLLAAEALTFAGDWEAVIANRRDVDARNVDDVELAMITHYAAFAHAMKLDWAAAERLWKDALRILPGTQMFAENRADMKKPEGQRHGGFAFPATRLLPISIMDRVAELVSSLSEDEFSKPAELFEAAVAAQPALATVFPAILDLCDPQVVDAYSAIVAGIDDTQIRDYVYGFVLGRRGSDQLRLIMQAALSENGYHFDDPIKMWMKGVQTEVSPMGMQIVFEAVDVLPPDVEPISLKGYELMEAKNYQAAIEVYRDAVAKFPQYPGLWNNLAASLGSIGEKDEAIKICEQLLVSHPDYLFARAALATQHALEGEIDKAKEMLKPIKMQGKIHISEFRCLANAHLDILANDDSATASDMDTWLDMIDQADPDNPRFDYFADVQYAKSIIEHRSRPKSSSGKRKTGPKPRF